MSTDFETIGWKDGQTAEDLAHLVHESLGEHDEGVVIIPCEDFALPDHIVLGGNFEHGDVIVPYVTLLSGAFEYFHGIKAGTFRAVPTEAPAMSPFSMALEVAVSRQPSESYI